MTATRELIARELEAIRARRHQRLGAKRSCTRCGRRHGEAIMAYPDGSWFSSEDGYHYNDGTRFTGAQGRTDVEHRLAWVRAGRTALVVVNITPTTNLCARCELAAKES